MSWSSKHKGYLPGLSFSNTTSLVETKCQLNRGLVLLWLPQKLAQDELELVYLCCHWVQISPPHTGLIIKVFVVLLVFFCRKAIIFRVDKLKKEQTNDMHLKVQNVDSLLLPLG